MNPSSCFSTTITTPFALFRILNFSDPADKPRQDRMVTLVDQMPDLNKRFPEARTDQEQTIVKRQIVERRIRRSTNWCISSMGSRRRSERPWREIQTYGRLICKI